MEYCKALEYIHSLNRFGIKPGLERIACLMSKLKNPQDKLNFIHIAGTNGKGSTCSMLSNIMIADGKKTGLFISPFVVDFRERIQINGEYIKKEKLAKLTEQLIPAANKVFEELGDFVTEFEFITALAFLYFREEKCDVVVLETGLGGRLDSTNIIKNPLATVITKIDLDHIGVLGDTIEKIAYEKCGIVKSKTKVVTASTQNSKALSVIKETAHKKNADFILADRKYAENIKLLPFETKVTYKGVKLSANMAGAHQVENMITAAQTAMALGVDENAIIKGIANTSFPARLEIISKNPLVILDGAHNDNGASALADYLDRNSLKPVIVLGMMKDKDCDAVVNKICSRSVSVITVTVSSNPRAETENNLAKLAAKYCEDVCAAENYDKALSIAYKKIKEYSAPLLVCGSLYLASDIRQNLISQYN